MTNSLQRMIAALSRLPGIGQKTAARLAYAILGMEDEKAFDLADSIAEAKENIHPCPVCGDYTDADPCEICADPRRLSSGIICVVRDPRDLLAMERMREYRGLYHVLHGLISPMDGIGPSDIGVSSLVKRVEDGDFNEVVIALPSTVEGEATASYIAARLSQTSAVISRLAQGVAVGGDLEYTDELTLRRAMENRKAL